MYISHCNTLIYCWST